MEINYPTKKLYKNNLFISIEESTNKPIIILNKNLNKIYTLLMFDPEAIGGNKIHWLIINIKNNNILKGDTLIDYIGPKPPKRTGKHHYTFVLFKQTDFIEITNIKLKSRFIELNKLFKKLGVNQYNFVYENIKYFVSENT
jgi:phosphatidylethanolamine-binding protein (PEBP) family uncharacterized protein